VESAQQLLQLSQEDRTQISGLGRAAASTLKVHLNLLERPIATAGWLSNTTGISPASVNKALVNLEKLGIVKKLTTQKRNRLFSYTEYVEIMNRGTELP
jgi:Fic family protein